MAASAPVLNPSKTFKNQIATSQRIGWQTEAWDYLDKVGELRYYVSWRAGACSRVRIVASQYNDEGMPTGKCDNDRVNQIASAIAGGRLGQAQLIKRAVECLTVVGELWIAIIYKPTDDPEGPGTWLSLSRDEIKKRGQKVTIELPDGDDYTLTADDSIFRIWSPRPRKSREADSPVLASLDVLAEIVRTTRKIRNADNSRLIGNGVVFVPQEMSLPMSSSPTAADKVGAPPGGVLTGTPAVQELQDLLFNVAVASFEDESSHAALIPIFASVPGEMIGKISHVTFDNQVTDLAIKTRNDAIARLAMGLDVSPERLLGLGSSTSHWSAWQIGDNDIQLHLAPAMEIILNGINEQIFAKLLDANGIDSSKYLLWYDSGELTADPDKTETAHQAYDRGVINAEAYRDFLHMGDSGYDLLNGGIEEWRRWAVDKVATDPDQLQKLLPLLDSSLQDIEFPSAPAIESGQSPPSDGEGTNEGNKPKTEDKDPGYDQGKRGRKGDVATHQAIVELMVFRALELAGKRRRRGSGSSARRRALSAP